MSYEELLESMADIALKQLEPKAQQRNVSGLPRKAASESRYIPRQVKAKVWKRDEGKCTYVSPITGKPCGSKHFLQLDHVKPYALGGENSETNLRLLCAQHNLERSRQTFGVR